MITIKDIRDRLDLIQENAQFDQELLETGIFEELIALLEKHKSVEKRRALGKTKPAQSPLLRSFGGSPAGIELGKYLHTFHQISNRAHIEPFSHSSGNLDLMLFKRHYDNFMILKSPLGWAAITPETNYLRTKLDAPPPKDPKEKLYNPSRDQDIRYVGIISLNNGDDIFTQEIIGTRGGAYNKREKKGVERKTIADQLKDLGLGNTGIEVYRLMERDDPSLTAKDKKGRPLVKPERFSGQRSRDLGPAGASVQRAKVDARSALKKGDSEDKMNDTLADRIYSVAPRLIKQVNLRRKRAKKDPINVSKVANFKNTYWPRIVRATVHSIVHDPAIKPEVDALRPAVSLTDDTPAMDAIKDRKLVAALTRSFGSKFVHQLKTSSKPIKDELAAHGTDLQTLGISNTTTDSLILLDLIKKGNEKVLSSLFSNLRDVMEKEFDTLTP